MPLKPSFEAIGHPMVVLLMAPWLRRIARWADVAPDHWRHIHNRPAAGEQPRPYTLARHKAWLLRRSAQ